MTTTLMKGTDPESFHKTQALSLEKAETATKTSSEEHSRKIDSDKPSQNRKEGCQNYDLVQKGQSSNINSRTIGHYVVGKTIGQGTFGKVRLGTHTLTGEKVAIKILEKEKIADKADVERVTREIHILKIVRHPNVIQLYEIIETNKQLFLIMEYADGGELFDYIVKKKRLQDKESCKYFQQILSGIDYLHKLKVCHRDLKPENLLLDENKNIKIVDFGLSNTYKVGETLKTACGSPCYAAPEMIAGKRYHGLPADIWSLGVILYAMTCGYLPFEDPNTKKLYKKILSCDYLIPGFISFQCKDLIKKVLNTDPNSRYKISDIRSHTWYTQIQSVELEGILVGQDQIPVIEEIKQQIQDKYNIEDFPNATAYIKMNKHNHVTSTYYLILKKAERETGKNLVFEMVTTEKRGCNSTGNLGSIQRKVLHNQTFFRGNSQQLANRQNVLAMNQTSAGGFINASSLTSKSEKKTNRTDGGQNLNPLTQKYTRQIEDAYSKNSFVAGSQNASNYLAGTNENTINENSRDQSNPDSQKFNSMRDTSVAIDNWIQDAMNKGPIRLQSHDVQRANTQPKYSSQNTQQSSIASNAQINDILPTVSRHPQLRQTMYNNSYFSKPQQINITNIRKQFDPYAQGQPDSDTNNKSRVKTFKIINNSKEKIQEQIQKKQDATAVISKNRINFSFLKQTQPTVCSAQQPIRKHMNINRQIDASLYAMYKSQEPKETNQTVIFPRNKAHQLDYSDSNKGNNSFIDNSNQATKNFFSQFNQQSKRINETAQAQQLFPNSLVLPFQVNNSQKQGSRSRGIPVKKNYPSDNQYVSPSSNPSIPLQPRNQYKQANQNVLFGQKGDYRVKLSGGQQPYNSNVSNGFMAKTNNPNLQNRKLMYI